ncbi:MAG: hypothetical protein R3D29_10220 [Nitratireductor sp.]
MHQGTALVECQPQGGASLLRATRILSLACGIQDETGLESSGNRLENLEKQRALVQNPQFSEIFVQLSHSSCETWRKTPDIGARREDDNEPAFEEQAFATASTGCLSVQYRI